MGVTSSEGSSAPVRPSPLGRSLTIAPDSRGIAMMNDAKSLRSPTFPPGQVDPTYPPPPPGQHEQEEAGGMMMSGQMMSPTQMSPTQQTMISPSQQTMNPPMVSQSMMTPSNPNQSMVSQQHMAQANLSPSQRSLVGGGFGNGYEGYEQGYTGQDGYDQARYTNEQTYPTQEYTNSQDGYTDASYPDPPNQYTPTDQSRYDQPQPYVHTPPSFEASPTMGGVPVLGPPSMEIINLNGESKQPMLFQDAYEMMSREYAHVAYS